MGEERNFFSILTACGGKMEKKFHNQKEDWGLKNRRSTPPREIERRSGDRARQRARIKMLPDPMYRVELRSQGRHDTTCPLVQGF